MNFKEKVQSMTGKEIVMSMVNGLHKSWVEIDMNSYGRISSDGVCCGCAATNTICEILNRVPDFNRRWESIDPNNRAFVQQFEDAIDSLRQGDLDSYNTIAKNWNFAQLPDLGDIQYPLPMLHRFSYIRNLVHYEKYANALIC